MPKSGRFIWSTFPAVSSSFLSLLAFPANIFISTIPDTAIIGTTDSSRRVNCQPYMNDMTMPVPRLAVFCAIKASLVPVAWKSRREAVMFPGANTWAAASGLLVGMMTECLGHMHSLSSQCGQVTCASLLRPLRSFLLHAFQLSFLSYPREFRTTEPIISRWALGVGCGTQHFFMKALFTEESNPSVPRAC